MMTDQMVGNLPPLIATAVLAFVIYRYILYPAFLSPLAKIPNAHWSAPLTPAWNLIVRYRHKQNTTLAEAHERLGPYVRIGPSEISVDDIEGVKAVYQGGFEKTTFYSLYDSYGVPNMFSTLHNREHTQRKRMLANIYSKSYIQSSPAAAAQAKVMIQDRLLPVLKASMRDDQKPQGIDVLSLFFATMMDFVSAYVYGVSSSADFILNKGYRGHWLALYDARSDYTFFPQELPGFTAFCQKLGIKLYPNWVDDANTELADWNAKLCRKAQQYVELVPEREYIGTANEPIGVRAMLSGIQKEQEKLGAESVLYDTTLKQPDEAIASELYDHLLAGQETSGLTLTYASWHISKDLELQAELRRELATARPNETSSGPNVKDLDALPLLQAVLMETMRLHAPIPSPLPRQTPDSGAQVGPHYLPGRVRVSALAYTLHRAERVFPDPESWQPRRWLSADEEQKKMLHRQFWAFASGGRMCIGSNFAMQEMKQVLAAIYTHFTTHVISDDGMRQVGGYTAHPEGKQLWLRFEAV